MCFSVFSWLTSFCDTIILFSLVMLSFPLYWEPTSPTIYLLLYSFFLLYVPILFLIWYRDLECYKKIPSTISTNVILFFFYAYLWKKINIFSFLLIALINITFFHSLLRRWYFIVVLRYQYYFLMGFIFLKYKWRLTRTRAMEWWLKPIIEEKFTRNSLYRSSLAICLVS